MVIVPHKLTIEHEKLEHRCTKDLQGKDLIYKGYNTNYIHHHLIFIIYPFFINRIFALNYIINNSF